MPNRFQKLAGQMGFVLIYALLFIPALYGLQRLPRTGQLWLSLFVLFVGLLWAALALIDDALSAVSKLLAFTMQLVTELANRIAHIIDFCLLEGGMFLAVEGFCLLVFVLLNGAKL